MSSSRESRASSLRLSSSILWAVMLLAVMALQGVTCHFSLNYGLDLLKIPVAVGRSLFRAAKGDSVDNSVGISVGSGSQEDNITNDSFMKTPDLVKKYGYPAEIHRIVTEDGYILEMHRIATPNGIPVLLTHGLLDSSATWVMMGPDKGLAYQLHDLGYDVWMTNMRGNIYSRQHTKYSTDHGSFWDFTFHEMGKFDLPASIDYVLETTQFKQLHYIGHSQGTMTFWVMCSERPEYSEKVLLMQALAPVAFIEHSKSPIVKIMAFFQRPMSILLNLIGKYEFLPNNDCVVRFTQLVCDDETVKNTDICSNFIFLITGFDRVQLNETMLPVIMGHYPAGGATKQMQHFGQLKKKGYFRQYDYGWIRNRWHYSSITPPNYKLENVRNKVALHYSQNDWLAMPDDVEHLHQLLPNVIGKFLVSFVDFNHLDFVWGVDVKELLYTRLFKMMDLVERGEL